MMTKYTLIFVLVFAFCTAQKAVKHSAPESPQSLYKIIRIDSVNNYYLIYARHKDTLFKVVSKKEGSSGCKQINAGGEYPLNPKSLLIPLKIGDITIDRKSVDHLSCFTFENNTPICLEGDSIRDLHFSEKLRGLSFCK